MADLFSKVLRPIAEHRGLDTWEKLAAYAAEEWYPSRIAFGKHKGRLFQEAPRDAELRRWLEWLAGSSNARSAKMGRRYLEQLEGGEERQPETAVFAAGEAEKELTAKTGRRENERFSGAEAAVGFAAVIIYVNPELEKLRQLVAGARARLAELEVSYTTEKSRVDAVQTVPYRRLAEH